jgi:hypothetical protein
MATQDATYLNQTGFAPEIAPYGQNLLGMAAASIYDYQMEDKKDANGNPVLGPDGKPIQVPVVDAKGMPVIAGLKEVPQYEGDRQAQFTDLQKQAFAGAKDLGVNAASQASATGLQGLATKLQDLKYDPTKATNEFTAPGTLGYTAKEAAAATGTAASAGAAEKAAAQGYTAKDAAAAKVEAPKDVGTTKINEATTKAAQAKGLGALAANQMGPASTVTTKSFAQPGSADAYMSPYMQNVVEMQKREAARQSGIQGTQQQAQAAQAGAFGGGRDAIMRAERERNLAQQMGDIQATGSQAAYQQAQAQFNAEQNAGLTAQQANQQAGLTVGQQNLAAKQGTQQLEANTGVQVQLANLNAEQQANVQNAAQQFQASGMNADQAMKAALANQSTALTTGTQNASMQQQANLTNANAANQASQFGAAGTNAANLANAAAGNQMSQYNAGLQQQTGIANLANQQQANLTNANAANQAAQFGAGQGLTAAQTEAQYGQAANQLSEQSKQFGAGQGLAALQAAGQTNAALGAQGQNIYNQGVNNLGIQNTMGTQQQQGVQNILTQKYTDFQNEVNAPYKQLGFMSDIVRGAPTSVQGTTVTTPAPSLLNQVAGAGTALFGLGQPTTKARGGAIKQKKINGLPALLINSMARG